MANYLTDQFTCIGEKYSYSRYLLWLISYEIYSYSKDSELKGLQISDCEQFNPSTNRNRNRKYAEVFLPDLAEVKYHIQL